jgi:hypothetical protein
MFNAVAVLNSSDCTMGGVIWNSAMQLNAYADLYFAPTAEAVRRASSDAYDGDPIRVQVVLGSVANAYSEQSLRWLDRLLNHTMTCANVAPSLHGKRVADVVQIASIHYLVPHWSEPAVAGAGGPPPSENEAADEEWRRQLDRIGDKWLQPTGPLAGLWATEEHGKSGYGIVTAWKVYGRWLNWWVERSASLDFNFTYPCQTGQCSRGKASLWGTDLAKPGGSAIEGMTALGHLLGDSPLSILSVAPGGPPTRGGGGSSIETSGVCTAAGGIAALLWRKESAPDGVRGSGAQHTSIANITLRAPCVRDIMAQLRSVSVSGSNFNATLGSAVTRPRQLHAKILTVVGKGHGRGSDAVTIGIEPAVALTSAAQETLLLGLTPSMGW